MIYCFILCDSYPGEKNRGIFTHSSTQNPFKPVLYPPPCARTPRLVVIRNSSFLSRRSTLTPITHGPVFTTVIYRTPSGISLKVRLLLARSHPVNCGDMLRMHALELI